MTEAEISDFLSIKRQVLFAGYDISKLINSSIKMLILDVLYGMNRNNIDV